MALNTSRLALAGASSAEIVSLSYAYNASTQLAQAALDLEMEQVSTSEITAMLNAWRGGGLFGVLDWPHPSGPLAVLTGNPADDTSGISAGTGQKLPPVVGVTSEKVWLQDPTLPHGPADPTGASFVNAAVNGAIAKAQTAINNGWKSAAIAGAPGSYKWDPTKGGLGIPPGILLGGNGTPGSMLFSFPVETNLPGALGVSANPITANQATLAVTSVRNAFAPASPSVPQTAMVGGVPFTYTGITGSGSSVTLTGCVGLPSLPGQLVVAGSFPMMVGPFGGSRSWAIDNCVQIIGPHSQTSAWATATPPTGFMDGIFVSYGTAINPRVIDGFRMNAVYAGDHETFGGEVSMGAGWCQFACMAPATRWDIVDNGNQLWKSGLMATGASSWCVHYVCSENAILAATMDAQTHQGNAPWWMWKDAAVSPYIVQTSEFREIHMEQIGLGVVGCPDDGSYFAGAFRGGVTGFGGGPIPSGFSGAVAGFKCRAQNILLDDSGVFASLPSSVPVWISDAFYGRATDTSLSIATIQAHPPQAHSLGTVPDVDVKTDWGVVSAGQLGSGFGAINAGDVTEFSSQPDPGSFPSVLKHLSYGRGSTSSPMGVAVTAESANHRVFAQVTRKAPGPVTANVRQQSTPPTSPGATTSATAGTLPAGTYYYKVSAVLANGGETGASAEVSVALSGSNSASLSWSAPSAPHGQTISGYRIYRGTSANGETGYISVGALTSYTDTGASLTTATPPTTNKGCEVWAGSYVRAYTDNSSFVGAVCSATGPNDTSGPVIGWTVSADNGATCSILVTPALE